MKKVFFIVTIFVVCFSAKAQNKVFTKTGTIFFNANTSIEKIEAINKKVLAVIDIQNNKLEFAVLIKGFEFERALMQEHFNENYLESDKYPKATFKGKFNVDKLNVSTAQNGSQTLPVTGILSMHGVNKMVTTTASITSKNNTLSASCTFKVVLSDYNIKVPAVNKNNVNNQVQIDINLANLQPMN
jgi:polyisoprenoid-binding protein YceI